MCACSADRAVHQSRPKPAAAAEFLIIYRVVNEPETMELTVLIPPGSNAQRVMEEAQVPNEFLSE